MQLLDREGMGEWVGVMMHELPAGGGPAIDLGDAHGHVLIWQVGEPSVLPQDHDEDRCITPRVCRGDLEAGLAIGEGALPALELAAPIGELFGGTTVRRSQGEARRMVREIEIAVDVAPHPRVGCLGGLVDQLGDVGAVPVLRRSGHSCSCRLVLWPSDHACSARASVVTTEPSSRCNPDDVDSADGGLFASGPYGLPPTRASIALPGVDVIILNGSGLASVQGYFSESTLLNKLGAQGGVRPRSSEPVAFGVAIRVRTDRRRTPGAISLTWIDIRSEEEHDEVLQRSHAVVSDMTQMAGFLGWIGVRVGKREYTITGWADPQDVAELGRKPQHREAVERIFGSDLASATTPASGCPTTSIRSVSAARDAGDWTFVANSTNCACGAKVPPPQPFL